MEYDYTLEKLEVYCLAEEFSDKIWAKLMVGAIF
jgi:hypothetical protein